MHRMNQISTGHESRRSVAEPIAGAPVVSVVGLLLLTADFEPANFLKNDPCQFRRSFAVRRQQDDAFSFFACHAPRLLKRSLCLFVCSSTDIPLCESRQQRWLGSQHTDYRNPRFGYGGKYPSFVEIQVQHDS